MDIRILGFIYTTLGTLSTICGISILILYSFSKSLQESPGMLIFWHIFSQTCIDFTIALTGFRIITSDTKIDEHCRVIGGINVYFYFLGINYVICLCLEVLKKMQNPMENNYGKRSRFYHILSHLFSLSISFMIGITGYAGVASNHFCMIDRNSKMKFLAALPLGLFLPAFSFTFYVLFKMKNTTVYVNYFVKKHSIYVTSYFCIWCPIIINILIDNVDQGSGLSILSVILTSSSSLILTIIRVTSYYTIKYLSSKQKSSANRISIASLINDTIKVMPDASLLDDSYGLQSDYSTVFNSLSTESALTAIIILQHSLLFCYNKRSHSDGFPWTPKHYEEKNVISVHSKQLGSLKIPKNLKKHYSCQKLEYIEHASEIFKNIMNLEGITAHDLIHSFDILTLLSDFKSIMHSSGGRSGSFFVYSMDKKYIIKTISTTELKILLSDFLVDYHTHLYRCQDSVISRIIGVYSFKVNSNFNVNFIVMQSIFNDFGVKEVYDLKGSKLNREVRKLEEGKIDLKKSKVLKDINFLTEQKQLFMTESVGQRMIEIIENDAKLFKKFNIMDYSLLVAVKTREEYSKFFFKSANRPEKGYAIGIIDYLQSFNKTKRFEGISKQLLTFKPTAHISSINSEDYYQRFLKFIRDIINFEEET